MKNNDFISIKDCTHTLSNNNNRSIDILFYCFSECRIGFKIKR